MKCRIALYFCFAAVLSAQPRNVTISGEIAGGGATSLQVELQPLGANTPPQRTLPDPNGGFSFANVPPGVYTLRLLSESGETIAQETVQSGIASGVPVRLRVPQRTQEESSAAAAGPTVSLYRLRHRVPRRARREYERAERCKERGDLAGSVKHLERALEQDPGYLEAHNNLGARVLALGDTPRAVREFAAAADLDPSDPMLRTNLAYACLMARDFAATERAARSALALAGADPLAEYLLALALLEQRKNRHEALTLLDRAGRKYPKAAQAASRLRQAAVAARD